MAVVEDASSPTAATADNVTATTLATSSFTPPANAVIVAFAATVYLANAATNTPAWSISDSLGGTWTQLCYDQLPPTSPDSLAAVWARTVVGTSAAMTVTLTSDALGKAKVLQVVVYTGASGTYGTPVRALDSATTANALQQNLTTTVAGSRAICLGTSSGAVTLTANANTTTYSDVAYPGTGVEAATGKLTNASGAPGAVSLGWTHPATGTRHIYQAVEILPAVASQNPRPVQLRTNAAVQRSYTF